MGVRIREKRPGEWWIFVHYGGKRLSKKIGDRRMALEAAKKIQAKLVLNDFRLDQTKDNMPSFKQYSEKWLETYVKSVRRLSTYERYSGLLIKFAYPEIGSLPLDKINKGHIRDILLKMKEKGFSHNSINLMKNALSGVFSYALDEELIDSNPTSKLIKSLNLAKDKRENIDPLNKEEVETFLKTCLEIYPEYYAFFFTAFRTGMRLGELLGLQWSDVDWYGKFIQVSRSYKLGRITSTKSGKIRRVDMSDQLMMVLKAHLKRCKEEGFRMGLGDAPEFVFHQNGAPLEQNYIRRIFKRILQKAGLREVRIHDIRHSFASLLLSEGVSPVYVKQQLGHHSIQVTVDIYGHWIQNENRRAINILDEQTSLNKIETEVSSSEYKTYPLNLHQNAPQAHPEKTKELQLSEITALFNTWCRRGDSNPYVATHTRP